MLLAPAAGAAAQQPVRSVAGDTPADDLLNISPPEPPLEGELRFPISGVNISPGNIGRIVTDEHLTDRDAHPGPSATPIPLPAPLMVGLMGLGVSAAATRRRRRDRA